MVRTRSPVRIWLAAPKSDDYEFVIVFFLILKLYREDTKKDNQNTAAKSCESLAATAVDYAASLGKLLDYTPSSIPILDEILQIYHEDIHHSEPTEDQVYSIALIFGAYLGECIRLSVPASSGCRWVIVEGEPVLDQFGVRFGLVSKVYRRLTNCEEESLIPYYHVVASFVRERPEFDS